MTGGTSGLASELSSGRERLLLGIGLLCALVVVADVITLKLVGEVPSGFWWFLAVPIGIFFFGVVGIASLLLLVKERRDRA